ncbi:DNA-processing protein DprA [Leptothermofonsia sp. ETS-13]|uniref:DNA-processing protein DprA n=1 Tax=Leptothermofonsia sp. ETS-13 TaxID=3035696 RepID=UPI003BA27EA2
MEERAFWLAWSQINGIGPILLRRLEKHFGTLADAWEASYEDLIAVDGLGSLTAEAIAAERRNINPKELLQQHERDNPYFWTPADAEYPRLLLEIPDPPPVLYYQGKVNLQECQGLVPMVGIVGTRNPSEYGKRWTRRITRALVNNGFTVVSGLAEGIDTEAHRSCVEADGRTLAVMGTGVDIAYPWFNHNLYRQILQCGLALSEYPAGTQPDRIHFPRRNRIIAGLCRAILVMEAPKKSGALITAHMANEYGRDVFVLPGSLENPKAIGCLNLLYQGAQVILGEDHLLEMLGTIPQLQSSLPPCQTQLPLNLEPNLEKVLQTLTTLTQKQNIESVPFDLIVQNSELPAGSISSALLQLELLGLVSQLPGMRYQKC